MKLPARSSMKSVVVEWPFAIACSSGTVEVLCVLIWLGCKACLMSLVCKFDGDLWDG